MKKSLFHNNRVINIFLGVCSIAFISLAIEHYARWPFIVVALLMIIPLEYVIKRQFEPEFELDLKWGILGMAVGMLTVMPLIVTPNVGGQDDQHKSIHHAPLQGRGR